MGPCVQKKSTKEAKTMKQSTAQGASGNYQPVFGLALHPIAVETAFGAVEPHDFGRDARFGDDYFV